MFTCAVERETAWDPVRVSLTFFLLESHAFVQNAARQEMAKKSELEVCCISFTSESWGIKASTAGATVVSVAGAVGLEHWNHWDIFETPSLGCLDTSVGQQLGLDLGCLFEIKLSAFIRYVEISVSRFYFLALYNEALFLMSFCHYKLFQNKTVSVL